jgi:hypothetical protein
LLGAATLEMWLKEPGVLCSFFWPGVLNGNPLGISVPRGGSLVLLMIQKKKPCILCMV